MGHGSDIVSYIRLIIRAAIQSSPSTSPIKDKVQREVSLNAFSDSNSTKIFDYGLGTLMEDDDDDVVILDPDIP